jgi:hypothetical protein
MGRALEHSSAAILCFAGVLVIVCFKCAFAFTKKKKEKKYEEEKHQK